MPGKKTFKENKIKDILSTIESDSKFRDFKKKNPGYYLAHLFYMEKSENEKNEPWQAGYYDKKKDKMVVFSLKENNKIEKEPESEIFKKDKKAVNKLELKKIKIDFEEAKNINNEFVKSKYNGEPIKDRIYIIQKLEKHIWNITNVSRFFNIINVKIDAQKGKVIKSSKDSLMGLGRVME
ncbi:hypothetical protein JW949_01105 [Candidatus Woesearchaeota archaeon]|nr:hypothetical protein [Candidatus Woesearchaeota archaeon]